MSLTSPDVVSVGFVDDSSLSRAEVEWDQHGGVPPNPEPQFVDQEGRPVDLEDTDSKPRMRLTTVGRTDDHTRRCTVFFLRVDPVGSVSDHADQEGI
jgi:hypothetical protein